MLEGDWQGAGQRSATFVLIDFHNLVLIFQIIEHHSVAVGHSELGASFQGDSPHNFGVSGADNAGAVSPPLKANTREVAVS